jgi:hypothetical protein
MPGVCAEPNVLDSPWPKVDLRYGQQSDSVIKQLFLWVESEQRPSRNAVKGQDRVLSRLCRHWENLVIVEGLSCKQISFNDQAYHQIIVPSCLRPQIIEGWVRNCLACVKRKSPNAQEHAPLVSITTIQPLQLVWTFCLLNLP